MTTILLVRHGHSVTNQKGIFTGQTDVALSCIGIQQSALTAEFICKHYTVNKIYSSDLNRAVNTALPLAEKTNEEIIKDKNLREIYGGDWEGKKVDDIMRQYPDEYAVWKNNIGLCRPPHGESVEELQKRAKEEFYKIAEENDGKTVAIFSHACFIRVLQCLFINVPLSGMHNIPWVPNASVTEVIFREGTAKITKLAQAEHLEKIETVLNPKL